MQEGINYSDWLISQPRFWDTDFPGIPSICLITIQMKRLVLIRNKNKAILVEFYKKKLLCTGQHYHGFFTSLDTLLIQPLNGFPSILNLYSFRSAIVFINMQVFYQNKNWYVINERIKLLGNLKGNGIIHLKKGRFVCWWDKQKTSDVRLRQTKIFFQYLRAPFLLGAQLDVSELYHCKLYYT